LNRAETHRAVMQTSDGSMALDDHLPTTVIDRLRDRFQAWRDRQLSSPAFRRWAAAFPLTRPIARRRASALFDLVAGFSYTQVLLACVRLRLFERLAQSPASAETLAPQLALPLEACLRLLDAAVALRLLSRRARRDQRRGLAVYSLGPLGAPMVGNSALVAMVDLAHRLGARSSFKVGDVPTGTEKFALTPLQREWLVETAIPAAKKRVKELGHTVKHNLDAFEQQLRGQRQGPLPACFAGHLYSRVSVDGQLYFCCAHIEAGHLKDGPFEEVWRSAKYQALRAQVKRGEMFPACARCGKHDMNFAAEKELHALRAEGTL
jgi:hypothetical protein